MKKGRKRRLTTGLIAIVAALALVYLSLVAAVCVSAGRESPPQAADCVIVLGARVWPDGRLSNALEYRCDSALAAWQAGLAPALILCGGQGGNEPVTEASAMRDWMVAHGVPEEALFLDETSVNTVQNLENARSIMAAQGFRTAAVCTSDYHLRRAMWIADDAGIDAVGIAAASPKKVDSWVTGRLREACSWALYWFHKIGR